MPKRQRGRARKSITITETVMGAVAMVAFTIGLVTDRLDSAAFVLGIANAFSYVAGLSNGSKRGSQRTGDD